MKRSLSPHIPADAVFSRGLRRLAWLNIAIQATFPLAVAFTPVIASAEPYMLQPSALLSTQRTQVYTLTTGESAASVAKKYHITLEQLRELNQFRTFAHGMDRLRPGDELDVPMGAIRDKRVSVSASRATSADEKSDKQAQKVAGYASRTGRFLSSNASSDEAVSMATGIATGEAGGALQQWLSHFGTARVQLDVDKNFSLKNSQFDLLLPLYDRGDNLVLTQGSLHRTDSRTQANLGAGLRHFTATHMLGGNLFGDYDLSRDHARMGVGVEYWRDFLKLGANGYKRLTNWKDSPDLTDYQERPANGWDIRAQAWVPSLPQLGGKLTYEQYYGQEVALFGVDDRQKNPHAITAGINYTPVPLITLAAEQRQGESGKNDTRFSLEMNYQLGVAWRTQVDPAAVAGMRSLNGSRYDLVDRNNNIVLEYRRKDVIRLKTADLVTGYSGEQKSLAVSVVSKYGLDRIDWTASSLIAAGGKIVLNGSDWAVVLPAYQSGAQAVNTYTVSGVAVDTKGNRSEPSDTQVTVQAPEVNEQTSTFTPASSALPADGISTQLLTLTLRDENNQPVDLDVKEITLKSNSLKSATVSVLTRQSAGVYAVTVTAGTDNETVTLTPSVRSITLPSAGVVIGNVVPDAGQSAFTANPAIIAADNTASSTLTLLAKDAQGNPLTGLKDNLAFVVRDSSGNTPAAGSITESTIIESSTKGTYTATLQGTAPGIYTVVPEYKGSAIGSLSTTLTLTATAPAQGASSVALDNTAYVTGADMRVTVTLRDASGNAVSGQAGQLTPAAVQVANATLKAGSSWSDNGDGSYTAIYTAGATGQNLRATLRLGSWSGNVESAVYAITNPVTLRDVLVNGYTFAANAGFPTTGFQGAVFTLQLNGGQPTDFNWSSDASWVSVTNGVVTFTGTGSGGNVTITGISKSGSGETITYSFALSSWFINNGATSQVVWSDASVYCSSQSGYSLPTAAQMSLHSNYTATEVRGTGALWNEWGNLSSYSGAGFQPSSYWSTEQGLTDYHYTAGLNDGFVGLGFDASLSAVTCRQGL